jgi:hypothetical protein
LRDTTEQEATIPYPNLRVKVEKTCKASLFLHAGGRHASEQKFWLASIKDLFEKFSMPLASIGAVTALQM